MSAIPCATCGLLVLMHGGCACPAPAPDGGDWLRDTLPAGAPEGVEVDDPSGFPVERTDAAAGGGAPDRVTHISAPTWAALYDAVETWAGAPSPVAQAMIAALRGGAAADDEAGGGGEEGRTT